jgi:hypothetical protein
MRSLAIRLGIVVVIVVVGLVVRTYISRPASDLGVGDCYDQPQATAAPVDDITPHPCGDAHFAEVVFVGTYSGGDTYPTEDAFQQYFVDQCVSAYNTYTGSDILTSMDMDMGYFYPTSDGWTKGDKKITCYAHKAEDAAIRTITGTLKK